MKKRSKRFTKILKISDKNIGDSLEKVFSDIKKNSNTKFDESIDFNFQINVKNAKNNVSIRNVVNLPNGSGKKVKVAIICEDEKLKDAKNSGADDFGSAEMIDKIEKGKINFDKLISTPAMMSKVGKLGKVLGPKGLMPNPKLGTVTNDLLESVKLLKSGQIELKNDKDGNIGGSVGKKSFSTDKLLKNFNTVLEVLKKEKPPNFKGNFILSSYISSTMGVSYKLKIKGIN